MSTDLRTGEKLLVQGRHWTLRPMCHVSSVIAALPDLLPPNSVLVLADGQWSEDVRAQLKALSTLPNFLPRIVSTVAVAYHFPVTRAVCDELSARMKDLAPFAVATHVLAYCADGSRLEWYDVPDGPICMSTDLAADRIEKFGVVLGCGPILVHAMSTADDGGHTA